MKEKQQQNKSIEINNEQNIKKRGRPKKLIII
jgi:hypothetical protein